MNIQPLAIFFLTAALSGASRVDVKIDTAPEPVDGYQALGSHIDYPEIAHEAGHEGDVVVWAHVNQDGRVTYVIVADGVEGTGLDEAALEGIRKARFEPALHQGRPVSAWMAITVRFRRQG